MRVLFLFIVMLFPLSAQADYYVWQDVETGMSISFPDTWKVQTNQNADHALVIMAPSENEQPLCTVSTIKDKRYTLYPADYGREVQYAAASKKFWDTYLGRYSGHTLGHVVDGAGLGRWHASYAMANYTKMFGSVMQKRRAIMHASLYRDTLYVLECSSLMHGYENWAYAFQSVVKSVDFKKAFHELPTGAYADFLTKARRAFWAQTSPLGTTNY